MATKISCQFLTAAELAALLADPSNTKLSGPYPSEDECLALCSGSGGSGSGGSPPLGSLVGWWPLNEGSGTVAHDHAGVNDLDGVMTFGAQWSAMTPGSQAGSGGSVKFAVNATSDTIASMAMVGLPLGASDISVSFWFYLTNAAELSAGYGYNTTPQFIADLRQRFIFGDTNGVSLPDASASSNDGFWRLYTLVWTGGNRWTYYKDSALVDSGTAAFPLSTGNDSTGAGAPAHVFVALTDGTALATANIKDLRIYSTALSAADVALLFTGGLGP